MNSQISSDQVHFEFFTVDQNANPGCFIILQQASHFEVILRYTVPVVCEMTAVYH